MYQPRTIALIGDTNKQLAIAAITNAPVGQNIEIVIREVKKQRSIEQQALMFAGPLKDISEQVWVQGRQYSVEAWHEYYKQEYLPDELTEPYIHELVTKPESYKKWDYLPNGERRCIASTTQLTKYGYTQYLEKIHADGASKGVLFTTKER
jgi:replication-associated recombination protein RarA